MKLEHLRDYSKCLIFFNKFIYFKWRLITLQYCIGFAMREGGAGWGTRIYLCVKILR